MTLHCVHVNKMSLILSSDTQWNKNTGGAFVVVVVHHHRRYYHLINTESLNMTGLLE